MLCILNVISVVLNQRFPYPPSLPPAQGDSGMDLEWANTYLLRGDMSSSCPPKPEAMN
jgi:hypothetical protein